MKSMIGAACALVITVAMAIGGAATANATTSTATTPTALSRPISAPGTISPSQAAQHGRVRNVTSAPSVSGGRVAPAETITCTPQVQNPHNSTHVNGTVNVVVTLKCTSAVPRINIRAGLYRNGNLVKDSNQKTVYNSSSAQNNAAVPCRNGRYQGWMAYSVLFPSGFNPPTGASSGFGNQVQITC